MKGKIIAAMVGIAFGSTAVTAAPMNCCKHCCDHMSSHHMKMQHK